MLKVQDKKEIRLKLQNGDFNNVEMDLYEWMSSYDYQTLYSLVNGCVINENTDIFYIIATHVNTASQNFRLDRRSLEYSKNVIRHSDYVISASEIASMSKPDILNFANKILTEKYDYLMKHILSLAYQNKENSKRYTEVIELVSNSPIENFRVYSSYYLDNPEKLLNDTSNRVQKIASLRINFPQKLENYSNDEKELINFLTNAIKVRAIQISDGLVPCFDETNIYRDDWFYAIFRGLVKGNINNFDKDVFKLGEIDSNILASAIYERLLTNELSFESGMEPQCYQRIIKPKIKKLK